MSYLMEENQISELQVNRFGIRILIDVPRRIGEFKELNGELSSPDSLAEDERPTVGQVAEIGAVTVLQNLVVPSRLEHLVMYHQFLQFARGRR